MGLDLFLIFVSLEDVSPGKKRMQDQGIVIEGRKTSKEEKKKKP